MEELNKLMSDYELINHKLREAIIKWIIDRLSKEKDGTITFVHDDDDYDPVYVLVETCRQTADMGLEEVDNISLNKDKDDFYVTSVCSNISQGNWCDTNELITIYERIRWQDNSEDYWEEYNVT